MKGCPPISVVVPTRNHAELLEICIRSCLAQDSDDFELVVSDNASTDDTQEVARSFTGDARVRYQRAFEYFPVMADSWEYARGAAGGGYMLLVGDDDVLARTCIRDLLGAVRDRQPGIVAWRMASFDYRSSSTNESSGCLRVPPCTGREAWMDTDQILHARFAMRHREVVKPLASNTCYQSTVVDAVAKRAGRFYLWPHPDVTSSTMALAMESRLLWIDRPLTIGGIAASSSVGNLAKTWVDAARRPARAWEMLSPAVPQILLFENLWAESFLRAKARLPQQLALYELDVAALVSALYRELADYSRRGEKVDDLRLRVDDFLHGLPFDVRMRLAWAKVGDQRQRFETMLSRRVRDAGKTLLERTNCGSTAIASRQRKRASGCVSGLTRQFTDACDAAGYLDELVRTDSGTE